MSPETTRRKLLKIFDISPELKEAMFSEESLDVKRQRFRQVLSNQLLATFDDDPSIPPLEWVLTRDAIRAFRTILSNRSERLAGFSFLQYIDDLIHDPQKDDLPSPSSGFFAELEQTGDQVHGADQVTVIGGGFLKCRGQLRDLRETLSRGQCPKTLGVIDHAVHIMLGEC